MMRRPIASLQELDEPELLRWRNHLGGAAPAHLPGWLLARVLGFRLQAQAFGDVSAAVLRKVRRAAAEGETASSVSFFVSRAPATRECVSLRPLRDAFARMAWHACTGHGAGRGLCVERQDQWQPVAGSQGDHWRKLERPSLLQPALGAFGRGQREANARARIRERANVRTAFGGGAMKPATRKTNLRCAIYTRASSDSRLEQEFNSLDNRCEASEAYIKSQTYEGWKLIRDRYDDGGFRDVRLTGPRCSSCSRISGRDGSTSSSCTRWIASHARLPTPPNSSNCSTSTMFRSSR
jgi:hypothetical protein